MLVELFFCWFCTYLLPSTVTTVQIQLLVRNCQTCVLSSSVMLGCRVVACRFMLLARPLCVPAWSCSYSYLWVYLDITHCETLFNHKWPDWGSTYCSGDEGKDQEMQQPWFTSSWGPLLYVTLILSPPVWEMEEHLKELWLTSKLCPWHPKGF